MGEGKCVQVFGAENLEEVGVDGRIILKMDLKWDKAAWT